MTKIEMITVVKIVNQYIHIYLYIYTYAFTYMFYLFSKKLQPEQGQLVNPKAGWIRGFSTKTESLCSFHPTKVWSLLPRRGLDASSQQNSITNTPADHGAVHDSALQGAAPAVCFSALSAGPVKMKWPHMADRRHGTERVQLSKFWNYKGWSQPLNLKVVSSSGYVHEIKGVEVNTSDAWFQPWAFKLLVGLFFLISYLLLDKGWRNESEPSFDPAASARAPIQTELRQRKWLK